MYKQKDIERALRRADRKHGLLAIPQPPRWPLYAAVVAVALAFAGMVSVRHAELRFVRFHMDERSVEVGR